jgi:hypothetical protein
MLFAGFFLLLAFAYSTGYWIVAAPFLPLTPWMVFKVLAQRKGKSNPDQTKAKKE